MDTSYIASVHMINTFLPLLLQAKGTIVNHGSIADFVPVPLNAAHCAAKAALYAYSRTLRLELAPFGVDVVYLRTANVRSNKLNETPVLGPDSLYSSISKPLNDLFQWVEKSGPTADEAAKDMVSGILRKRGWIVRVGHTSWTILFTSWLENVTGFDIWGMAMTKTYALDKVKR